MKPADELRNLIADGGVSEDALQAITGIDPEKLRSFLDQTQSGMARTEHKDGEVLTNGESARLSVLAAQLTAVFQIADEERLAAILVSLTIECGLTLANTAHLTRLEVRDLESCLRDPTTVAMEKKYSVAIRASYLINVMSRARPRSET